jgi:hypothetical protein
MFDVEILVYSEVGGSDGADVLVGTGVGAGVGRM